MLLESPDNFSENGARPVQFLGRPSRLIGWARSFSDTMTVTDNTIVGGHSLERLTRIAGRDVSQPDGHTVGKTFSRKDFIDGHRRPPGVLIGYERDQPSDHQTNPCPHYQATVLQNHALIKPDLESTAPDHRARPSCCSTT